MSAFEAGRWKFSRPSYDLTQNLKLFLFIRDEDLKPLHPKHHLRHRLLQVFWLDYMYYVLIASDHYATNRRKILCIRAAGTF